MNLKVWIGYDAKETIAYHVLAHSILSRSSRPVEIVPLVRSQLAPHYTRPRGEQDATDFSLTRFLVPYLSGYEGQSLFLDCDMLCQIDIHEMLTYAAADPDKAVYVCQHDYIPKTATKFLGQAQTQYPRKNWSSVMLFDNARCRMLTPEYVNIATGLELHRFHWLSDGLIGSLPLTFNWLVGEYEPNPNAKLLHYTLGTPCFADYRDCDHADLWRRERLALLQPLGEMHVA